MAHRRERFYTITQRPLSTGSVKRVYIITCSKCGRQGEQHAGQLTDDMRRKQFQRDGWDVGKWKNLHICPQCAGNVPAPEIEAEEPEPVLPEPTLPKSWLDDLPKLQQAWNLTYEDEHLAFIAWLRNTYGDRYVPTPASSPTPTLQELLEASSDEQRIEFWRWLRNNYTYSAITGLTRRYSTSPLLDLPVPVPTKPATSREEIDEFLRQMKEGAKTPPADDSWQHGTHIDSMPVEAPMPPIENPPAVEQVETPADPDNDEGAEDWYVELMKKRKQKQGRVRK